MLGAPLDRESLRKAKTLRILALRLKDGTVTLMEAPPPALAPGFVRVRTLHSAVSPGTEGGKIVAGQKSLLGKARSRPDQVRQVVDLARAMGIQAAISKVRAKLEGAQPLGYSLSGVVSEVGEGVTHVKAGDIVACGGGGYANHADEVVVPANLTVRVPEGVVSEEAAFATLGAIALQGVRLAAPTLGETAVVIGLGVIGQFAGQLLRASGCRVLGTDVAPAALELAKRAGSADVVSLSGDDGLAAAVEEFSRGQGVDMVMICAATASDEPLRSAGRLARRRGRVVIVGAVGMTVPREDFYNKEIPLVVSCSYGPGRYDPTYEEGGLDYPVPYVRWTEQRNMEAFLDMIGLGKVRPRDVITHRFLFADAPSAYRLIAERSAPFAGILLDYPESASVRSMPAVFHNEHLASKGKIGVGFVGAGSYAQSFLLPPLKASGQVEFSSIFTRSGLSAADIGQRYGFRRAVGSLQEVLKDPATTAVFIASRHDQHGPAVVQALRAGKHVFVEKPLCIKKEELQEIASLLSELGEAKRLPVLQVGFNRRFSPAAAWVRRRFGDGAGPYTMLYRVNAGALPREHWIQDPQVGGGRILGEMCHFVDMMQSVCGAKPSAVYAQCIGGPQRPSRDEDNAIVQIAFADGSVGAIGYFADAGKTLPKERFEISAGGRTAIIDNFMSCEYYSSSRRIRRPCPGKGQKEEVRAFLEAVGSGQPAVSMESLLCTSLVTFAALDSLRGGGVREVSLAEIVGPRSET